MARHWGSSWGAAWGSSWGAIEDAWSDHWGAAWSDAWGHTASAAATTSTSGAGGGRRKPKRAWYIEVDGQWFEAENAQHAKALLQRARDLAKEVAPAIVKAGPPPRVKIKAPKALMDRAPTVAAAVEDTRAQILAAYQQAWEAAMREEEETLAAILAAVDEYEAQIIAALH